MLKHIQDLEELFALGYFFEPTEPAVLNHIPEAMKEKKMTVPMLAERTGSTRQAINSILNYNTFPGIEIALKFSAVLEKDVQSLFELTNTAWIGTAKDENNRSIYYDAVDKIIRSGDGMKGCDKLQHYHVQTGELVTKEEYEYRLNTVIEQLTREEVENGQKTGVIPKRDELAAANRAIQFRYEEAYPRRFQRLYSKL